MVRVVVGEPRSPRSRDEARSQLLLSIATRRLRMQSNRAIAMNVVVDAASAEAARSRSPLGTRSASLTRGGT